VALLFLIAAIIAGLYLYNRIQDELADSKPVPVPLVEGLREDEATALLENAGFEVSVERTADPKVEAGRVAEQIPKDGTLLPKGQEVTIVVSLGAAKTTVPALAGLSYGDAVDELTTAGLKAKRVDKFSNQPVGTVISQDPKPNTTVVEGSTVEVRVSKGTESATVPDVVNQDEASARSELQAAGFKVSVTEGPSDTVAEGLVISQNPGANTTSAKGSTIGIVVSTGPTSATVPSVIGEEQADAENELEFRGFNVQVLEQETSDPNQHGVVLDQNPSGGVRAEIGSTVRIWVGVLVSPRRGAG
jgi:serine/threonine-protein kinase